MLFQDYCQAKMQKGVSQRKGEMDMAKIAIIRPGHYNGQWRQLWLAGARSVVLVS